jgi:hypothetical protein
VGWVWVSFWAVSVGLSLCDQENFCHADKGAERAWEESAWGGAADAGWNSGFLLAPFGRVSE